MSDSNVPMSKVWEAFGKALDAKPLDQASIKGRSGLEHAVLALSVDETDKRIIIVSSEPNSRTAALIQSDVQGAHDEYSVLLARPLVFDLGFLARRIVDIFGTKNIDFHELKKQTDNWKELDEDEVKQQIGVPLQLVLTRLGVASQRVRLPTFDHFVDILRQTLSLDWHQIIKTAVEHKKAVVSLEALTKLDDLAQDRSNGICPLPLYEFSEDDWTLFIDGRTDEIVTKLQNLNIYQYFYPPPDGLALAIVESGLSNPNSVKEAVELAPRNGHLFGDLEHVTDFRSIPDILEQLGAKGYVAEGEHGIEITPDGQTVRSNIRFRPRESIVTRLLNRLNLDLSVSPKDFIPR